MTAHTAAGLSRPAVHRLGRGAPDTDRVRVSGARCGPSAIAGVTATVVFFGSARLRRGGALGRYVDEATELARLVTEWSCTLHGGSWSCAPAAARASWRPPITAPRSPAAAASASTSGCRTSSARIPTSRPGCRFEFHYFFMRKLWFAHLARALVAFPGGFGTFDELFEILTLAQTRKLDRSIPVFLYGSAYWHEVVNFEALVRHGTIAAEDLTAVRVRRRAAARRSSCSSSASALEPAPGRQAGVRTLALSGPLTLTACRSAYRHSLRRCGGRAPVRLR